MTGVEVGVVARLGGGDLDLSVVAGAGRGAGATPTIEEYGSGAVVGAGLRFCGERGSRGARRHNII